MMAKNLVMYNESCFTMDTFVRHEVKILFISFQGLILRSIWQPQAFPALVFLFMNILIDNLLMQFFCIQNRKMYLSTKILYQYIFVFGTTAWDNFSSEITL